MKKILIAALLMVLLMACSASQMEKTKDTEYKNGTTYEQLFKNYSNAERTEWFSDSKGVYANSVINIGNSDVSLNQKVVFKNKKVKKIVWRIQGKTVDITAQNNINEVLTVINNDKPILDSTKEVINTKLGKFLRNTLDDVMGRVKNAISDVL